jgi:membrane protein
MTNGSRELWEIAKQAVSDWSDDYAPSMGAALAYYTIFSLAPLLVIVIAIAGLVFGEEAARGQIMVQLQGLMGADAARAIETLLEGAGSNKTGGAIATIVGFLTLLLGATTVFGELQNDLDRIWKAKPRDGSGIWNFLRTRLLSFGLILAIGFLLIVSLVVSAALAALGKYWSGLLGGGMEVLLHAIDFVLSFAVLTGLFAIIYKMLPRVPIAWRDVWTGAAFTSLLFGIGKLLIGLYIGKSGVASSYGAAGTVVLLLVWVYYSAQIFLLGAEFTKVYAQRRGSHMGVRGRAEVHRPPGSESPAPA